MANDGRDLRASVAACYRLLSGVMRSAVRDRLIGYNSCEGVRLPPRRRKDTDEQTVSREELLTKLLPAVPDRYRALVALAAGTGLRWGECAGAVRRLLDARWASSDARTPRRRLWHGIELARRWLTRLHGAKSAQAPE